MDMRFNVEYKATGIPKPIIGFCGEYLLKAHNRMAELTNGHYESWNKEWNANHGDNYDDKEYVEFINSKASAAAIPTLEKEFGEMTFEFGEEHQLIGHVKCMEKSSIEFFMVPVN